MDGHGVEPSGTQTSGYKFGIGQDGQGGGSNGAGVAGSGGGYYGGATSSGLYGTGGSSFVSGNENCNAISENSTEDEIVHTNQPNHYSGKVFKNSITYNGDEEEIVVDLKTYKYNNNTGDGFAVFTFLGETEQGIDVEHLYSYTGSEQEFIPEQSGYYKIECWGASGGKARADGVLSGKGGTGGYTSGTIYLNKNEKIYVYVGGKGEDAVTSKDVKGGYNGGGLGTWDRSDDDAAGAGGGATDIRLVNGEWDNFDSLKSRIMVAGGGARS